MILLLIVFVAGFITTNYLGNKARQEMIRDSEASVLTLSVYVSSTFNNLEGAVKSLAGSPWIAPVLLSKGHEDFEHANSVLDRYNSALNASVSYLIATDGMTVASSNRKDPDSFLGKSYGFRPYFRKAAMGQPGRYFGLGITSGKRGFFTSYPVQNRLGKVIGVVTMKKDLDDMETFFSKYPFCFLISPDGIIFLSSSPTMILKSLWPLNKSVRDTLIASQQFGNKLSEAVIKKEITDGSEVTLGGKNYFVSRHVIDSDGWSIVLLTETERLTAYKLIGILSTIFACFLIIVFAGVLYLTDRSQKAIRQSEESKRLLLHAVGIGIFGVDVEGRMTFINPAAVRMLGFSVGEMLGQNAHALIHHSHKDGSNYPVEDCPMYSSYTKAIENRVADEILWRKDGSSFPVEYSSTPLIGDSRVIGVVVTFEDITERKQVQEALSDSEIRLRTLVQTIPEMIWLKDNNGVYLSCNTMFERFFGAKEADIVGKTDYDFVDRELADSFREHDRKVTTTGKLISKEDWITFADDGHRAFVDTIKTPMYGARGTLIGVLGIGRDITERKRVQEVIRQMAYHDTLTGLPNRTLFFDRLGIALAQSQRNNKSVAITMLDLDKFKDVNDTLGHEEGDLLLKAVAERLVAALRKGDTVARFGGDEFVLILPDLKGIEDVIRLAEKIVDSFRTPFLIKTHQLIVTTSIGIAVYPDDGTDETILLKNADKAMYQAKQTGRNRYQIYKEA